MARYTLKIKHARGQRYKSVRCSCCGLPRIYPSMKLASLDAEKYKPVAWKITRVPTPK